MSIMNRWQDVRRERFGHVPNLPDVAIRVARALPNTMSSERIAFLPSGLARKPMGSNISQAVAPKGLASPILNQPENIMSLSNGLADKAWSLVQKWEGGYSNDRHDPGGETNFGIAKNFNPDVDVKSITKDQAKEIFINNYFNPSGAGEMSPALGLYLSDAAFNQGLGGMRDIMRNAIGSHEVAALNKMDQREALEAIHNARMERYRKNKNWNRYGKGWTNRANDVYAEALALLGG